MTTKTLSITEALSQLQEAIKGFGHVSACKVEFGMWDFSDKPYVQLYVACNVHGEYRHTNVKADNFYDALDQVQQWYQKISAMKYIIETGRPIDKDTATLAATAATIPVLVG
jgi:hypothetical protein